MEDKPEQVTGYAHAFFQDSHKNHLKPKPLVITAPSGCGKGTLIRKLIQNYP